MGFDWTISIGNVITVLVFVGGLAITAVRNWRKMELRLTVTDNKSDTLTSEIIKLTAAHKDLSTIVNEGRSAVSDLAAEFAVVNASLAAQAKLSDERFTRTTVALDDMAGDIRRHGARIGDLDVWRSGAAEKMHTHESRFKALEKEA